MNKNLLALSVAVAALASSASAAVSSNIVGYVKLNLTKGLNLIANPLNNTGASGNNVTTLFAGKTLSVLRWDGKKFVSTDLDAQAGLVGGVDFALAPGEGVFLDVDPASAGPLTFVGEALTGTQTKAINVNNNFVGSKIPLAGTATDLGLVLTADGALLTWGGKSYTAYDYVAEANLYPNGEPSFTVGQGFVVQASAAMTWSKTFVVQ